MALSIPIAAADNTEDLSLDEYPTVHATSGPILPEKPEPDPEDISTLDELTPKELVELFSEHYGVDPDLAKAIVRCESQWRRTIPTQIPNVVSSASGYFQFLDSTWRNTMLRMGLPTDTDKHHPIISIQAGVWLLSEDGVRHWYESQSCWRYG